jgi:hypothetical protein
VGQGVHAVAFAPLKVPSAQMAHAVPSAVAYVPAGQTEEAALTHADAPAALRNPAAHGRHTAAEVAFLVALNVPPTHGVQAAAPAAE